MEHETNQDLTILAGQWYALLSEDARQLLVRPFGCISYGTANSYATLSKAAKDTVIRTYRNFGSVILTAEQRDNG